VADSAIITQMEILIVFGLPAAGKSFVGKILQDTFGFIYYDGDIDLTPAMKQAIISSSTITDSMRDEFFARLIISMQKLKDARKSFVVAQTFIKEKYRQQVVDIFPEARFILVETETGIREERLQKRNDLSLSYARKMCKNFDIPKLQHSTIINNSEGKTAVTEQLQQIVNSQ
jgi:gluconate kinase